MKIRMGFVSNSSSSSFCIFGVCLDQDEIIEKLKLDINEDDDFDMIELLEEKCPKMEIHSDMEDIFYIGKSWSSIKDDETGKQFKDSIFKQLKKLKLVNKEKDLDTWEEVIYS